jgi:PAS domain S-box-containing protein
MFLIDLLYNLTALVAISVFSGFIDLRFSRTQLNGKVLQGLLFGFAAVIAMMYPFVLTEGIIFDGRSVVISLSAAFFGPLTGSIAGVIAVLYRLIGVGGSGSLTGVLVVVIAFIIGLVFFYYKRQKKIKAFSLKQLYALGISVHLLMLVLMFTLPGDYQREAFQMISITVVGAYPLVSLLIGKILSDQELNLELLNNLRESEEQYRMLITHQTDLVVKVDSENRLQYVSPSYCRLFEKKEEDFIGKTFVPLIHEDDRKATEEAMERLIFPPHTAYMEQRVETPRGYRWLAWSDKAIVDKNGKIEAVIGVGRDITERKNAEIERRRSEERYRHLFNASPLGIILEDTDGLILEVNQTLCDYYEYQPQELIGKQITVLVPEQHRNKVKNNLEKILYNKMLHSTVEGVTKTGLIRTLELIETVITLPDGNLGILSMARDITEHELIKERLHTTQVRNAAIISAIPDMMFSVNPDGIVVDAVFNNEKNAKSWDEHSVVSKNIQSIVPRTLSDRTLQSLSKALQTGELVSFEYAMGLGHKQQWFDIRMVKSSDTEVLVIVRNISNRKQQEIEIQHQNRFIKRLLDSIPNPLFYMNREGVYLGVNKAFEQFYGIKEEEIVGKKIFELPFEAEAFERNLSDQAILSGEEQQQVFERVIQLADGTERNAIITKSPFPDSSNKIGGLIGIIMDITERKKMEQDLLHAKEKAEEGDKLKTSFLNNLSHEIRTPLNAIVGFAELLKMGYPADQQEKFIRTINTNAEQLLHIIDDVLAISRMDSERMPIENFVFNVKDLLLDLKDSFEPEAKLKSLDLILDEAPDIAVEADKAKIRQVLSGLISNALKYTDKGYVRFGCVAQNNELIFYTKDTGMGIPEPEQTKIFDRFYRGEEVQYRAIRGNGLGLSIAQGLIHLMKGEIHLKSEPGKGSEFSFSVPVALTNRTYEKPLALKASQLSFGRVLVVEDEEDNFELLRINLKQFCQTIDYARNGKEAVEMANQNSYELVLMDLKMPVMDGFEASELIHREHPELLIVAVSAYQQPEDKKAASAAGCIAFLEKPFQPEQLQKVLGAVKR